MRGGALKQPPTGRSAFRDIRKIPMLRKLILAAMLIVILLPLLLTQF
jgi:hypothetical protein